MQDRSAWIRGPSGPTTIGTRKYNNLTKFTRACATCGEPFSIYVTQRIADGQADSNNFALKNCEAHRQSRRAPDDAALVESNNTMRQELDGLYVRVKELTEENARLRDELAKYDLQHAMRAHASATAPVQEQNSLLPWNMPQG